MLLVVDGVASAMRAGNVRSIFSAGLDLLVPCVLCGVSLWTVSFRWIFLFPMGDVILFLGVLLVVFPLCWKGLFNLLVGAWGAVLF